MKTFIHAFRKALLVLTRILAVSLMCIPAFGQDLETIGSQDPVRFRGGLQLGTSFYNVDGIDRRKPPLGYSVSGDVVLSLYGVDLPVSFLLSNYQRDFRQPFNYFGLSPRYKWLTVHLGYRRVRFSQFTLNGHRFLGAGVEANPGILRFGAVYGKFRTAVEEDSTFLDEEGVRSLPKPAYARKGYSFKLGVGSDRTYLDFIYFKGKDDEGSLSMEPAEYHVTPAENATIGISGRVSVKDFLAFYADVGASAYTRDHRQDSISGDSESGIYSLVSKLVTPNITTQASIGIESGVEFTQELWSAWLVYKRIDPGYQTMGSYYFQTDLTQYLLNVNARTRNQKFRVSGSIGYQTDNVRNNKLVQTNRTIGSLTMNVNPSPKFGLDVQYSNFGVAQKPGLKSVSDTTRLNNINQVLNVSPRYSIYGQSITHTVGFTFSYNDLNDKNDFTSDFTEVQSLSTFLFYTASHKPTGIVLNLGVNRVQSTVPAGQTIAIGFNAGASKGFLENKIRITANYMRNSNKYEETDNGFTGRARVGLTYSPVRAHRIQLTYSYLKNKSNNTLVSRSFTEQNARVVYSYRFDTKKTRRK